MTYKLTYFNTPGRAEAIRFLLSYGGLDFEDNRLDREAWAAFKPETPFGKIPIFEYKGKVSHQSMAICRYLAKQVKLAGNNDWEDLEIDAAVDTLADLTQTIGGGISTDPERFKERFSNEDVIFYLKGLDEQIKKNNGYFALGRLTWADLVFASSCLPLIARRGDEFLADYPNMKENLKKVQELPKIKEWLAKHPMK